MIEISVGTGECHLTFDQGKITATGREVLFEEFIKAGRNAYQVVGCAPADGDPDRNAALVIIEEYGGYVTRYDP